MFLFFIQKIIFFISWNYHSPEKIGKSNTWGLLTTYPGGGFFQDLGQDRNSSGEILKNLKNNDWICRGTRAAFIEFTVYNANINLFAVSW